MPPNSNHERSIERAEIVAEAYAIASYLQKLRCRIEQFSAERFGSGSLDPDGRLVAARSEYAAFLASLTPKG